MTEIYVFWHLDRINGKQHRKSSITIDFLNVWVLKIKDFFSLYRLCGLDRHVCFII